MSKKKNGIKGSFAKNLVVLLLMILLVGIYYIARVGNISIFQSKSEKKESEYELLIKKDINDNYPASPKEVLKLYQRISKALYSEELSDEQLNELTDRLRMLLDEELLQNNTLENHLLNLKTEIASYKESKKIIVNYVVKTESLEEWTKNEEQYASLIVSMGVKEGTITDILGQRYVLRLDEHNRWKILGFERISLESDKKD